MVEHVLKTWPTYFDAVARGEKTFEGRRDDRGFQKGDTVVLQRTREDAYWLVELPKRELRFTIGFVLHGGQFGIEDGYCVFSLLPWRPEAPQQSERDKQIVSFAYGNAALHNPSITKDIVREAMREMEEE